MGKLQRVLAGKKSSLRKTYKNQAEANDKVWLLKENTDKAPRVMNVLKPRILTEKVAEAQRERGGPGHGDAQPCEEDGSYVDDVV